MAIQYSLPPEEGGEDKNFVIYPSLTENRRRSEIAIIVALAEDGAIGRGGDLLWHIPADLRRFKQLTSGHTVIMGRKTYLSLPRRPLPNRRNIVISRNPEFSAPGAEVFSSIEDALEACKGEEEIFIIGGATVYAVALPLATRLYLTHINARCEDADTWFPPLRLEDWTLTDRSETFSTDQGISYYFADYKR